MKYLQYTILAIFLFIVVAISMMHSCKTFRPTTATRNYTSFEGFSDVGTSAMEYNKIGTVQKILDPAFEEKFRKELAHDDNFFNKQSAKKVEGFGGLQGSPYEKEKTLDIFIGTPGSLICDGNSFNLSNSQGGLCLDETQTRLMRTRGGNAETGDFQIGS